MKKHIKAKYVNEECDISLKKYPNGDTAILLTDPKTGETISQPTASVEGIPGGCVAVKDYAESEGMLNALIEAGVISKPYKTIPSGFVDLHICWVLI